VERNPSQLMMALATAAAIALVLPHAAVAAQEKQGPAVEWSDGPLQGALGKIGQVKVGEGCGFADAKGTQTFLTLTQNPTSGQEQGTVLCQVLRSETDTTQWFAIFEYDEVGYVKDDEKAKLDADEILASLREGNEAGNEMRRERGWETLDLVGWERAPFYDPATNNLTWATRVRAASGDESINHSVRLLGRGGVMKVDLVVSPDAYAKSIPAFDGLIASHEFNSGLKYAEWREGDKVAAYGLTALVAGGAGALALKSGLLGKFWKVIAAAGVALVAGIRKLFGRKEETA
jgi:uncharacterized membrane-anchored protein